MEPGITWYEVLGVLPGAAAEKIRRRYQERVALLRGEMIAGAPSNVLAGVRRAQEFLDGAWEVLGDPATRERYDEAAGFRRRGGGLTRAGTYPTGSEMDSPDTGLVVDQSPRAPGKVRRGGSVTVHVWHPPARPGSV
jgi:curved DNA-binding protein CbpA